MAEPRRDALTKTPMLLGGKLLIVEARFYDEVSELLLTGARRAIELAGATCDIVTVPGSLEIPIAMRIGLDGAAESSLPYDGAVALGCVVRGETYHFDIVAGESSRALIDMAVAGRIALGNGILTVENDEQAMERADPNHGDKGGDAARAAIALAALKRRLAIP